MNNYQKRIHIEVLDALKKYKDQYSYRQLRRSLKANIKFSYFSPCENCDNPWCKRKPNKLGYCSKNR